MDILALAAKKSVGANLQLNQRVSGQAALDPGAALIFEAQHLAAFDASRDIHVERSPLGQRDASLGAVYGVKEIHVQGEADVTAAHARMRARPAHAGAKEIGKDIAKIKRVLWPSARRRASASMSARALPRPWTKSHALVAVRIDFAAVETGFESGVGKQIEGGGGALEALLGLFVTGANVRV